MEKSPFNRKRLVYCSVRLDIRNVKNVIKSLNIPMTEVHQGTFPSPDRPDIITIDISGIVTMKSKILYTFLFFVIALITKGETIGDDDNTHHGPGCDPVVTSSAAPTIPTPSPYVPVSTTTRPPSTPTTSSYDFTRGGCKPVLMVYFRSQVDTGNIVCHIHSKI